MKISYETDARDFSYVLFYQIEIMFPETTGLHLTGVRNSLTGYQYTYKETAGFAMKYKVKHTEVFTTVPLEELMKNKTTFRGTDMEGYVINIDGRRLKLKCDQYLEIARTLEETSSFDAIVLCIEHGRLDDLMASIRSYKAEQIMDKAKKIVAYKEAMERKIEQIMSGAPENAGKKEFVDYLKNTVSAQSNLFHWCIAAYEGKEPGILVKRTYNKNTGEYAECVKCRPEDITDM